MTVNKRLIALDFPLAEDYIGFSTATVKGIIGDYPITDYLCTPSESPLYLPLYKREDNKVTFFKIIKFIGEFLKFAKI